MSLGQAFVDIKGETDEFLPDLDRKLKALLKEYSVKVKVTPNLTKFRAEMSAATKTAPVKIKVEADGLPAFRAAINKASKTKPVKVEIVPSGLVAFRKALAGVTKTKPVQIQIVPAGLVAFRKAVAEASKTKPVKITVEAAGLPAFRRSIAEASKTKPVKITVEATGLPAFRRDLAALTKTKPIKISVEATGLPAFRAALAALTKAKPIKIDILPSGIPAFRAALTAATRQTAVRVNILPVGIPAFRAAITAGLANSQVRVGLTVAATELARLRRLIQVALLATPFTIRINPILGGSGGIGGGRNPFDPITRQARSSASEIDKIFSLLASRLRRTFIDIPKVATLAFAGVGAAVLAADAAIATFGISAAVEVQQLQVAIQALEAGKIVDPLSREFQKGTTDVEAFGQAAELAADQIKLFQEFSIRTAFNFKDVATGALSLQTLGLNAGEALSVVEDLGNALALTAGGATGDRLQKALLPLLQAASTGKLLGQDLNQFAQVLPGVFSRGKFLKQLQFDLGFAAKNTDKLTEEFRDLVEVQGLAAGPALDAVLKQLRSVPGTIIDGQSALERAATLTLPGAFQAAVETIRAKAAAIFADVTDDLTKNVAKLGDIIGDALSSVAPRVISLVSSFVGALPRIIPIFVKTFNQVNDFLVDFFDRFGGFLLGIVRQTGEVFVFVGDQIDNIANAIARFRAFLTQDKANVPFLSSIREILRSIAETFRQIGPIAANVFKGIRDAFVTLAPVLIPIVVILTNVLEILAKILASDFGQLVFAIGALATAAFVLNGSFIAVAFSAGVAATASGLLTARFVLGAIAAGNFAGALAALRGTMLATAAASAIASASMLGFAGIVAAAGAAAFLAGKFIGEKLAGFFGAGGEAAEKLTTTIQGTEVSIEGLHNAVRTLNADGTISIVVRDNFGNVTNRLAGLNASLAAFRAANADLLNFSLDELQKAQLRSQQEDAEGKVIGPILPGTTRPDFKEPLPDVDFSNLIPSTIADDGKKAGDAVKAAADKLKERVKTAKESVVEALKDFAGGISEASAKQIEASFRSIREKLQAIPNFDESGLVKKLRSDTNKLKVLADQRDALQKRIEDRESTFNSLFDQFRTAGTSVADAVKEAADAAAEAAKKAAEETEKLDLSRLTISAKAAAAQATISVKAIDVTAKVALAAAKKAREAAGFFGEKFVITADKTADIIVDRGKRRAELFVADTVAAVAAAQRAINASSLSGGAASAAAAVKANGDAFAAALKKRAAELKAFLVLVESLRKRGLDAGLLSELVSAGPGSNLSEQLKGISDASLESVNKSQEAIRKTAAELAKSGTLISEQAEKAADAIGQATIDGLIKGLVSRKNEVVDAMNGIVQALIKAVRKELGIKSPSRVMAKMGGHIVGGLAKGLGNSGAVDSALGGLTSKVAGLDLGKISMPELSSAALKSARRA